MVVFSVNRQKQHGGSVLDSLLTPFTVRKYGNEMHGRSLDIRHLGVPYAYLGPHTEIKLREKLHDDVPINQLDAIAKKHDYDYLREQEEYKKDHDRKKPLNNTWAADDQFVKDSKRQSDDSIMGNISSKLISAKEN